MAGEYVEFQNLPTVKLSDAAFNRKYKFDSSNERYIRKLFTDEVRGPEKSALSKRISDLKSGKRPRFLISEFISCP